MLRPTVPYDATCVRLVAAVSVSPAAASRSLPGFVESFNISVAAALIMYEAQQQRIRKHGQAGDLTRQQQQQLLAAFLLRGVVSCWRLLEDSLVPA